MKEFISEIKDAKTVNTLVYNKFDSFRSVT